jgi:hypothetical protein
MDKRLNRMTIIAQSQSPQQVPEKKGRTGEKLPDMMAISYKSDADMSKDEMIQGLMEISAMSLPEEPHKYYSSHRSCTKT